MKELYCISRSFFAPRQAFLGIIVAELQQSGFVENFHNKASPSAIFIWPYAMLSKNYRSQII